MYSYINSRTHLIEKLLVSVFSCSSFRWLDRMESLMVQVNAKFQEFFTTMGYAGEVHLDKGKAENDFANYGIQILVKFRDNMPLQNLDPFRQSGNLLFSRSLKQCDQIGRNFATLAKNSKSLANVWMFISRLAKCCAYFGPILIVVVGQILKYNLTIWSHWSEVLIHYFAIHLFIQA